MGIEHQMGFLVVGEGADVAVVANQLRGDVALAYGMAHDVFESAIGQPRDFVLAETVALQQGCALVLADAGGEAVVGVLQRLVFGSCIEAGVYGFPAPESIAVADLAGGIEVDERVEVVDGAVGMDGEVGVHGATDGDLVGQRHGAGGFLPQVAEARYRQGRDDGENGDDHYELDEGEGFFHE